MKTIYALLSDFCFYIYISRGRAKWLDRANKFERLGRG